MADLEHNEDGVLSSLLELRDSISEQIEKLKTKLAIVEKSIADTRQVEGNRPIPKDRIIEVIKQHLLAHGPSTLADLYSIVSGNGGIAVTNLRKRFNTSITRTVTSGTLQKNGDLYDLTERERQKLTAE